MKKEIEKLFIAFFMLILVIEFASASCTDSDAKNYYTRGKINWTGDDIYDTCVYSSGMMISGESIHINGVWYHPLTNCSDDNCYLQEYYCEKISKVNMPTSNVYKCPYGCAYGVCLKEGQSLEDVKDDYEDDKEQNNEDEKISDDDKNQDDFEKEEIIKDLTRCPGEEEDEICYKNLSNGRKAEIKIMPETASARAIERLAGLGFNLTLKEVGKGSETKAIYEADAEKSVKLFGFIKKQMRMQVQIDAETGTTILRKPWWVFLVRE